MTVKSKKLTTSVHQAAGSMAFASAFKTNGTNNAQPADKAGKSDLKSGKTNKIWLH
jgi:hypothetical protein